ncbi:MAG: hypothetical protein ACOC9Y_00735 [Chloroflexota bacterium]
MREITFERYQIESLMRRLPSDRGMLFLGAKVWEEDVPGWERGRNLTLQDAPNQLTLRTIWDNPDSRGERILADVIECPSTEQAILALVDRLAANQLNRLPEGPDDLGLASYVHPEGVPPSVYFVLGNLAVNIASFGDPPVDVLPAAYRLAERLSSTPEEARDELDISAGVDAVTPQEEVTVTLRLPYRVAADAYTKFFVTGGSPVRREDHVAVIAEGAGPVQVEVFVTEPGRPALRGTLEIPLR